MSLVPGLRNADLPVLCMILGVVLCYAGVFVAKAYAGSAEVAAWMRTRRLVLQRHLPAPVPAAIADVSLASEIAERNERGRARWAKKIAAGVKCLDAYPPVGRMYCEMVFENDRRRARAWIRAGEQYRAAQAIAAAENVISLPLPYLLQRQGG